MDKQFSSSMHFLALLFLGISLFCLLILTILTFRFSTVVVTFPFQKEITGSIFISICLLGILIGVFPSKCLGILHFRTSKVVSRKKEQNVSKRSGGNFVRIIFICGSIVALAVKTRISRKVSEALGICI